MPIELISWVPVLNLSFFSFLILFLLPPIYYSKKDYIYSAQVY